MTSGSLHFNHKHVTVKSELWMNVDEEEMPVIIPCCYMRGLAHPWRCGTSVAHRRWRDLVTTTRVNGRPYRVQTRGVIFREPVGNTLHTLSSLCLLSVLCTLSTTISKTTRDPNSLSGPAHHRFGITGVSVPLSSTISRMELRRIPGFLQQVARSQIWPPVP